MAVKEYVSYKELKTKVKQGWDWDDFEEKYGLSSVQLKKHIRENLCQNENFATSIIKDLDANMKRKRKHQRGTKTPKKTAETAKVTEAANTVEVVGPTEANEMPAAPSATETPVVVEVTKTTGLNEATEPKTGTNSVTEMLNALHQSETAISARVIELEVEHKALVNAHREEIGRLHSIEEALGRAEQILLQMNSEYERAVGKIESLLQRMSNVSQERAQEVARLTEIRGQIEELNTIVICAYTNGTIAPFEDNGLKLDDSGHDQIYDNLMRRDECLDFRARDIQIIARLISIQRNTPAKIEVISEIEGLEQAFIALIDVA